MTLSATPQGHITVASSRSISFLRQGIGHALVRRSRLGGFDPDGTQLGRVVKRGDRIIGGRAADRSITPLHQHRHDGVLPHRLETCAGRGRGRRFVSMSDESKEQTMGEAKKTLRNSQ